MRERPILLSGPMVRAILAGTKTQTRRVIRSAHAQEADAWQDCGSGRWESGIAGDHGRYGHGEWVRCPFGSPGDRLWVREAWRFVDFEMLGGSNWNAAVEYRCDGERGPRSNDVNENTRLGWRPSIHMPLWASRITLEVMGVRVERLQEITEEDAVSEGMASVALEEGVAGFREVSMRDVFAAGWDTINGKRAAWDSNPWCWVVAFLRVQP